LQVIVLLIGLCLHALVIGAVPLILMPDSVWYVQLGAGIADRFEFSNEMFLQRPLGYPLFLAAVFALFGTHSPAALVFAQHLMVLATAWVGMMIAVGLTRSRSVMVLTGLGVVASFQLAGYANCALTEILYTVLLTLLVAFVVRFHAGASWRWLAVASAIAGISALVRPTGKFMVAICLLAALHRCWIESETTRQRLSGCIRGVSAALAPCVAVMALSMLFNGFVLGEFRTLSRTGAVVFTRTRDIDRLKSTTNEPLQRILAAMERYDASQAPGTPPLDRYSHLSAERACRAVYGMNSSEADQLMLAAGLGLIREHPSHFVRTTLSYMIRSLLLTDDVHRHVPGGAVADGWHPPRKAPIIDTNAYYCSSARLEDDGILQRYMPIDHKPGVLTKHWRNTVSVYHGYVERGPTVSGLTDSLYEDYVLLAALGAACLLFTRRRSTSVILLAAFLLHLLLTGLHSACPRYVAPLQPMLKLFIAVAVVHGAWAIGWMSRTIAARIPRTSAEPTS
jgi:hypothetical protein